MKPSNQYKSEKERILRRYSAPSDSERYDQARLIGDISDSIVNDIAAGHKVLAMRNRDEPFDEEGGANIDGTFSGEN